MLEGRACSRERFACNAHMNATLPCFAKGCLTYSSFTLPSNGTLAELVAIDSLYTQRHKAEQDSFKPSAGWLNKSHMRY